MPDSSCSPQVAVCSEIMPNKQSQSKSDSNQCAGGVQIDLGEVTQHNIKVLKKVNQVAHPKSKENYIIKILVTIWNFWPSFIVVIQYVLKSSYSNLIDILGGFSSGLSR